MHQIIKASLLASAALTAQPAISATNVVPAHWSTISWPGFAGVLRAGSPWGPGSTPSSAISPVDGNFAPESQQWNNGSFWWDQDASVNPSPVTWTLQLDQDYTFNQLVVQADNNDTYLVEYWDGGAWQGVFNIPAVCCFGLTTRDSGALSPFTTSQFRFSATGGDNYYSLSEFQAFAELPAGVPEPAAWGLMVAGFGMLGSTMRRRSKSLPTFSPA